MEYHKSVLLSEVLETLNVQADKLYIDATAGDGGHSLAIASAGGRVFSIDQDKEAITRFAYRLKTESPEIQARIQIVYGHFGACRQIAEQHGLMQAAGILFDLGVSTYQLKESNRGFSFLKDEKLDMRMDQSGNLTAADLINKLPKEELERLLIKFGEEHYAREIADALVKNRSKNPIESTKDLAKPIETVYARYTSQQAIHPATKVFQAVRIAVNNELGELQKGLEQSLEILSPGGKLIVISFHSLEDRIVKRFMKTHRELIICTKKPITPTSEEILKNPRSRSAKMRVAYYDAKA